MHLASQVIVPLGNFLSMMNDLNPSAHPNSPVAKILIIEDETNIAAANSPATSPTNYSAPSPSYASTWNYSNPAQFSTPLRSNMPETRPLEWVQLEQRLRRLIETVNSQLSERFHFERVRCRDRWHLTSRVNRKILAHTLCCWLNHKRGRDLLQFNGLLCDA
jgi:hypothetical protein